VQIISGLDYARGKYTKGDRVLLINPPVVETRYQWSRWNQPLDLLKLGSLLKTEFGCDVKLFDFMLPTGGKVPRAGYKAEPTITIDDYSYPLWRWGRKDEDFTKWLDRLLTRWRPTDVWITSLTSYWWRGVKDAVVGVKNQLNDANIVLYGQYPELETEHAEKYSSADVLINEKIELKDYSADYTLYEEAKPDFCAVDVRTPDWHEQVIERFAAGVMDFVFFNDPLIGESEDVLLRGLRLLRGQMSGISSKRRIKFHGICGLYPNHFTKAVAKEMKEASFTELHFEYRADGEDLDIDAYKRAREAYDEAEFGFDPDQVSGFVNIGLPKESPERIIKHALNLFEIFGSVILKPYSPTPKSADYERYKEVLETKRIERLGPHFFPFSKLNDIRLEDYQELYTLAASLNRKVRNKSFSSFPGTLAFRMIKTSLEREVWRLGDEKGAAH
jgi:hypothetical protein